VKLRLASYMARTLPHLAVIALMLVAFAPQSSAYWQCEGRICGSSPWACCCALPSDNHDNECGPSLGDVHVQSGSHAQEIGQCPAKCHCSVTTQSASRSASVAPTPADVLVFVVAAITFAPVIDGPVGTTAVQPLESRGPPPNAAYFTSPSLRAPPLA
jgi:hypothetical protein